MLFWALLLVIGLISIWVVFASKEKISFEHYTIYSGKAGTFTILASMLATTMGGGVTIGLISLGYKGGTAGLAPCFAYIIGFLIVGLLASKILSFREKNKIISMTQFLGDYYCGVNSDKFLFRGIVAIINIIIFFCLLAVQFVGMAALLKGFVNIGFVPALIFASLLTIAYTTYGGIVGVYKTDKIQLLFIIITSFFLFIYAFPHAGSAVDTIRNLDIRYIKGTKFGIAFIIGSLLFLWLSVPARIDMWQRVLSAKNVKVARNAFFLTALCMIPFYLLFLFVGMVVLAKNPDLTPKDATFFFLNTYLPAAVIYFCVIGFLAALISSADTFLNLTAITVVNDILPYLKISKNKEVRNVFTLRIITFICGLLALFIAYIYPNLVELFVAGTAGIIIFVPAIFAALFLRKLYFYPAYLSMMTGLVLFVLLFVMASLKHIPLSPEAVFARRKFGILALSQNPFIFKSFISESRWL